MMLALMPPLSWLPDIPRQQLGTRRIFRSVSPSMADVNIRAAAAAAAGSTTKHNLQLRPQVAPSTTPLQISSEAQGRHVRVYSTSTPIRNNLNDRETHTVLKRP